MPDVVVFRRAAPLAAFGEIAVGERRGTAARPSHSMVTGLVAAALGLPRYAPGHEALAAGFWLAVRIDAPGTPLADFHTAQTPPQRRGARYATRRAELADRHALGTIVSRRDYRADVAFTVLLWPSERPARTPAKIAAALNRPVFAPFAGRRSCPLGLPVDARVIAAESVVAAFAAYDAEAAGPPKLTAAWLVHTRPQQGEIAFDATLAPVAGVVADREEVRRDRLASRARWQFEPRAERIAPNHPAEAQGDAPGGTP